MKRFIRIASIFTLISLAVCSTGAFVALVALNKGLPAIESLQNYRPKTVSQVYSEHGDLVAEFFEERRYELTVIPPLVKNAFIAAEDSHFYEHHGVDFLGIVRAFYVNLKAGGIRQGASTITQQVARLFLLSAEKTYIRKIREIILAWKIERSLTKDQILHLYLNHIFLGAGAYGIEAAAQIYFGKSAKDLSLAEAAILGGLPQAPSRYSPSKNPDRVKRRQLYVLRQMLKSKFITQEQHDQAIGETVFIQPRRDRNKEVAPYVAEYVRQYIMKKYGATRVLQDGLKVFTTIDVEMNRYAQNALRKGLSELEKRQGYRGPLRKLKPDEMKTYFKDREFEERDDENVVANQEFEVSVAEAKGKGPIRMIPPAPVQVGDFLEGLVVDVDDAKNEVLVEYDPGFFARIAWDDLKWAHQRVNLEDEFAEVNSIEKASQALSSGDVILLTVKAILTEPIKLDRKSVSETQNQSRLMIDSSLEQHTEVEGALLSIQPHSGFVKAMVGGYSFERSEFNRALQAKRQPGSAFKPIVYATALDLGFTPASILQDSPITFKNQIDQDSWRPLNYDNRFVGEVTLRNSLLASRNITTIRLLNEVGIEPVITYSNRLGLKSPLARDFTLALGSSAVTMNELLQPYMAFATSGYRTDPLFIKAVVDRDGTILEQEVLENFEASTIDAFRQSVDWVKKRSASIEALKDALAEKERASNSASFLQEAASTDLKKPSSKVSNLKWGQVLSTETSFLMANLLKENVLYGTGRGARSLERPVSGKTGTTDENRDAWFVGFSPELVTGVWVGYDDLRILGKAETGSRAAVPIWTDFMARSLGPYPKTDFPVPETIEFVRIEPKTGQLADSKSKSSIFEAFVKGTAPTTATRTRPKEFDLYQRD